MNAVVVTDFDVHAMWLCRHAEQYFVALEETKVHLKALGVPEPLVTVSGIPIDPVFAVAKDKRAMRRKHGLEEDRFTILVSAGGFGVGPVGHLMKALARMEHSARVVAVCGRNEALKAELSEAIRTFPKRSTVSFTLLGFTTEMDELMTAADLFVGKPGGLTTSEVLAKGLPMVVINPIPGQEERNSDHLLEEGVAIRCNNLPALALQDRHAARDAREARPDGGECAEPREARGGLHGRGPAAWRSASPAPRPTPIPAVGKSRYALARRR